MTETGSASSPAPRVVNAAFYILVFLGVISLVAALGNPEALLQGLLYLIAAWGIRRDRAWSAYGLGLFTSILALVLAIEAMVGQNNPASVNRGTLSLALAFNLAIIVLLIYTGRAIEARCGRRGMAWPWIAASVFAGGFMALFGLYSMPSGSMENTLLAGDHLAVWRTHNTAPVRGEVVVHVYPVNRKDTFVKRVVGGPGDRIRIKNKQLFVNGSPVEETYAIHKTEYLDSYRDNFPNDPNVPPYPGAQDMLAHHVVNGEVVVPPGRYFVLGDNRDSSLDSRYWGFIQQSDIIGTPTFVYYSVDLGEDLTAEGPRLALLHVRWSRIFHRVSGRSGS